MTETTQRAMTPEDVLRIRTASDVHLSPDGAVAVFVMGQAYIEKETPPSTTTMVVTIDDGTVRAVSPDNVADRLLRWSPDGATLAVLSRRPHEEDDTILRAPEQIYLTSPRGEGPRRLTCVRGEIQDMAWLPDGSQLILLMSDPEPRLESVEQGEGNDAIEVERHSRFGRLWSVDVTSRELVALTPADIHIWEFALSPDGHQAVLVASDTSFEWSWYQARLAVSVLGTPQVRTLYTTPRQLAHPRFSPDGTIVSVISCTWSDRGVIGGDVLVVPTSEDDVRTLAAEQSLSVAWTEWEADGKALLSCGYADGEIALWRLYVTGQVTTLWRGQCTFTPQIQPRFSRSGNRIAVLREDTNRPVDLWVVQLDGGSMGDWRQVTRLHPETEEWMRGPVQTLHWTAADGTPIQGLLALPPDYHHDMRLPTITLVHGGPGFLQPYAFLLDIVRWCRPLTAHGYAVFLPNPRGSTGWGTTFTEANLGDMGGEDFGDIMAGIDHIIHTGVGDADRLGIGGFSYGGFMAAWAVTQTNRFKASVMFAGISDWRSFHGVGPVPTWDALAYGPLGQPADPYDAAGPYTRFSPIMHVGQARTPTLIINGEGDMFASQGYQFFRGLKDRGIEAEMIVYPREGHTVMERLHQQDMIRRIVDWYMRHLDIDRTS